MRAGTTYYRSLIFPSLVFFGSGLTAVITHDIRWMVLPYAWILIPSLFRYAITSTEQLCWLLLITLPLSTELNITPSLGIDFPDELLLMLLTGFAVIKIIHQPRWLPASILKSRLFFLLMLYLLWILVTCLYSQENWLSVKYLLAKTWYIIPLVILPQVLLSSKSRITKMAICLLVPMCFVVIQTIIRHAFYSFSFAGINKTLFPFFRNHVNYSSMLVCLLPVAWCVYRLTPADKASRKWILLGMLIGLTGLFLAYSRGAWVALLAGVLMIFIIRKKWMKGTIVVASMAIGITICWLVTDKTFMRFAPDHDRTVFHPDLSEHIRATIAGKDVSTAERWYRWVAGARMLAERPLTGFGPNSFYLHYRPYTVNRFETWVSNNPEHSTVHNYFLLIALEQGIPGLVLFCILFFGMLLAAQKLYHSLQSVFYKQTALITGVILAMIAVINSMSDMIETDKVGGLFWLCLGMILLLQDRLQEERSLLA